MIEGLSVGEYDGDPLVEGVSDWSFEAAKPTTVSFEFNETPMAIISATISKH